MRTILKHQEITTYLYMNKYLQDTFQRKKISVAIYYSNFIAFYAELP